MASIKKRRGKYSVVYYYIDENGQKRQKWETYLTEKEAKQEAGRCLRCDHFGYGIFKGGRDTKW